MDYDVVIGTWTSAERLITPAPADPDGKRTVDREIENTETAMRGVFAEMTAKGRVLVVVDQLPLDRGAAGSRGAGDGHRHRVPSGAVDATPGGPASGNAKTDARDAYVIANAALTVPHTLRTLDVPTRRRLTGDAARLRRRPRRSDHCSGEPAARTAGPDPAHPGEGIGRQHLHPAVLHLLLKAGGPDDLGRWARPGSTRSCASTPRASTPASPTRSGAD